MINQYLRLTCAASVVMVAAGSCTSRREVVFTKHPTPVNAVAERDISYHIGSHSEPPDSSYLGALGRQLAAAERVAILTSPGSEKSSFGNPSDLIAIDKNLFAVADEHMARVFIFEQGTSPVPRLVKSMDLRAPTSLATTAVHSVVAITGGTAATVFSPFSETTTHTFPLAWRSQGVCRLGENLNFRAFGPKDTQPLITQYSADGKLIRQFGRPYVADHDVAQVHLSQGPLACDEATGILATMLVIEPYVYGYSVTGKLEWVSKIDDFVSHEATQSVLVSTGSQQPRVFFNRQYPVGSDLPVGLVSIAPGTLLMQIARLMSADERVPMYQRRKLRSYLIDAKTGEGMYLGETLPRIVGASAGLLYSLQAKPDWALSVYRYQPVTAIAASQRRAAETGETQETRVR